METNVRVDSSRATTAEDAMLSGTNKVKLSSETQRRENFESLLSSSDIKYTVTSIMRRVIPNTLSIETRARDVVLDCMLEFASSLSYEAVVRAGQKGDKMVRADHFIHAVRVLGYEDYVEPITVFNKKRLDHVLSGCEICGGKMDNPKKKVNRSVAKTKPTATVSSNTKTFNDDIISMPIKTETAPATAQTTSVELSPPSSTALATSSTKVKLANQPDSNMTLGTIEANKKASSESIAAPIVEFGRAGLPNRRGRKKANYEKPKEAWEQFDADTMTLIATMLQQASTKENPFEDLRRMARELKIPRKILQKQLEV
jgi:hypothetical protein